MIGVLLGVLVRSLLGRGIEGWREMMMHGMIRGGEGMRIMAVTMIRYLADG